jgi:glycosyltransferase involved in cell wall biosynthesis
MKITIVQGAFLPVPPIMGGAVEKVWFGLGQEFVKQGHEVTHISRAHPELPHTETIGGVCHIRVPGFDTPKSLIWLKILDFIYSCRVFFKLPKADILITNTFWLPILVRTTDRGFLYVHVARYPKGQMRFYRHASRLQAVSSSVAEAIIQQDPSSRLRVKVIPNPLPAELSILRENKDTLHTHRQPWILYVGRIHPEKGIHLLIAAFHHLCQSQAFPDWRLVIVGPWETHYGGGGEAYYQDLQNQSLSIADQVDWIGAVFDPEQLYDYYRQASLFVYPSLAEQGESFGLAPLEAMAKGCPVLVSDLMCFKDFIQPSRNGFIFNHRQPVPELELATYLQTLIEQEDTRLRIAQQGYITAESYQISHIADQYLDDFVAVLSQCRLF